MLKLFALWNQRPQAMYPVYGFDFTRPDPDKRR